MILHLYLPPTYVIDIMFSSCLCVCVCVYVCVCVSVCLSVWAITFEWVDIETSFLVWCYILTISRSSLSIKVIGLRSRSSHGKCQFCYLDISLTYFDLFEVKVIKVKVIPRSNCKCLTFYQQVGGGPSTEKHSCFSLKLKHNVLICFYMVIILFCLFFFSSFFNCTLMMRWLMSWIVWKKQHKQLLKNIFGRNCVLKCKPQSAEIRQLMKEHCTNGKHVKTFTQYELMKSMCFDVCVLMRILQPTCNKCAGQINKLYNEGLT